MSGIEYKKILKEFEDFLESIPLEGYRRELLPIKTVEQDLPKDLNPIPAIYKNYWLPTIGKFPTYEEFFGWWWENHLKSLDIFIRKYFWGCSYEFVRLGFKARIYRTFISVLTQFHFAYSWLAYCSYPLQASADIDLQGIDALITMEGKIIAVQIMKETYRSEAKKTGRFVQRKIKADMVVEVPYTITRPEDWKQKEEKARKEETKEQAHLFYFLAKNFQRWLSNGFVVFQPAYPKKVENIIKIALESGSYESISWKDLLERLNA